MLQKTLIYTFIIILATSLSACGPAREADLPIPDKIQGYEILEADRLPDDNYIKVGYITPGDHGNWEEALGQSIEDVFTETNGYKLFVEFGEAHPETQYMHFGSFLSKGMDYIIVYPNHHIFDETLLEEAKDLGIPVFFVCSLPDISDENLYTCFVINDFLHEGEQAAEWLDAYLKSIGRGEDLINIVYIQGLEDAQAAQVGRTDGITRGINNHDNWNLLESRHGNWLKDSGQEVMEYFINEYSDINVLFAQNDYMALGAVEAMKNEGIKPGDDIIIVSLDGIRDALTAIENGEINATVETSSNYGLKIAELIHRLECHETIDKVEYLKGRVFDWTNAGSELPLRPY